MPDSSITFTTHSRSKVVLVRQPIGEKDRPSGLLLKGIDFLQVHQHVSSLFPSASKIKKEMRPILETDCVHLTAPIESKNFLGFKSHKELVYYSLSKIEFLDPRNLRHGRSRQAAYNEALERAAEGLGPQAHRSGRLHPRSWTFNMDEAISAVGQWCHYRAMYRRATSDAPKLPDVGSGYIRALRERRSPKEENEQERT
ncbi:hypothetical protein NMY22_g17583 [Coprinellus aureogranulatus]|nr:hypothetical protein NMY22_g17583 [Coprinellus aureogranulatus]